MWTAIIGIILLMVGLLIGGFVGAVVIEDDFKEREAKKKAAIRARLNCPDEWCKKNCKNASDEFMPDECQDCPITLARDMIYAEDFANEYHDY